MTQITSRITILSANVRGFRTNVGELTHISIKNKVDLIITTETFLDDSVPLNFARIKGYSNWYRRDRRTGQGGGVAVCHHTSLQVQHLQPNIPDHLEIMFFKMFTSSKEAILIIVCYRPRWQGREPIEYLISNIDTLMLEHGCNNVIIAGDLNQYLIQDSFEELIEVQGLKNYVTFPTHIKGASLDPVLTDYQGHVECESLGQVGSSDHFAVKTTLFLNIDREESYLKTTWLWKKANWKHLKEQLLATDWTQLLQGTVDNKTHNVTKHILQCQARCVPSRTYQVKSTDLPWFGYQCKEAARKKYQAWRKLKQRPTQYNRDRHKRACKEMIQTSTWAKNQWQEELKQKLRQGNIGTRQWWNITKLQQGIAREDIIPPLKKEDGTSATKLEEKLELLGTYFAKKMTVSDADKEPMQIPIRTKNKLSTISVTILGVKEVLLSLDTTKAAGPDDVQPVLLQNCASELSPVLAELFKSCMSTSTWPKLWKTGRIIPIHKKGLRSEAKNYRPVTLLSIISKVMERIIANHLLEHLMKNRLLSNRQYGFLKGKSASDLLTILSHKWNKALDNNMETRAIALDIAGAFDSVWHKGLLTKMKSLGIAGDLLNLFQDYLSDRDLVVTMNGQESTHFPIKAGVPQGSILGPILWNIYINDLLEAIPDLVAYADDGTIFVSYHRDQREEGATILQESLDLVETWSRQWQVKIAAEKTQACIFSRMQDVNNNPDIFISGRLLPHQESLSILGVKFDKHLTFGDHVKNLAQKASQRLSVLRRIKGYLERDGLEILYKTQVRSFFEYAPLAWCGAPQSILRSLDAVQRRAEKIISGDEKLDSLQHRRDVAGLTVFFKANILRDRHLSDFRVDRLINSYNTRTASRLTPAVYIPRASTVQFQRCFMYRYSKLWNDTFRYHLIDSNINTQQFKVLVNRLLLTCPSYVYQINVI